MDSSLIAFPVGLLLGEFLAIFGAYLLTDVVTGRRSRVAMATTFSDITLFVAASMLLEGVVRGEGPVAEVPSAWVFQLCALAYVVAGAGIFAGKAIERQVGDPPEAQEGTRSRRAFLRREVDGLRLAAGLVLVSVALLFLALWGAGIVHFD